MGKIITKQNKMDQGKTGHEKVEQNKPEHGGVQ